MLRPSSLDRIVEVVARLVRSPMAMIWCVSGNQVRVIGRFGIHIDEINGVCDLAPLQQHLGIQHAKEIRRNPAYKEHVILKIAPFSRNIVYIPVRMENWIWCVGILLVDPGVGWPFSAQLASILLQIELHVAEFIQLHLGQSPRDGIKLKSIGAAEHAVGEQPAPQIGVEASAQFLSETLVKRQSLKSRNGVAYVTLRTWRRPIKEHQIRALAALKAYPHPTFVSQVANEIVAAAKTLFGTRSACVVPVPCGHSRRTDCLSVQLARETANQLKRPFVEIFSPQFRAGASHPKQSAKLPPLKFAQGVAPVGNIILIDDVATSGRHIEQAVNALSERAEHVFALAWIGD